jgi:hypothetical protein
MGLHVVEQLTPDEITKAKEFGLRKAYVFERKYLDKPKEECYHFAFDGALWVIQSDRCIERRGSSENAYGSEREAREAYRDAVYEEARKAMEAADKYAARGNVE